MKRTTAAWVRKAEEDYMSAQNLRGSALPVHNSVCFHCQQLAEKYLKAILEELGLSIPKTHQLDDVLQLLLPSHPTLKALRRGLIFLTNFAVETRYPGETASKRQAQAAWRWAESTRDAARVLLHIRPRRKVRKKSP
jgi:HEPN domain-containing protein